MSMDNTKNSNDIGAQKNSVEESLAVIANAMESLRKIAEKEREVPAFSDEEKLRAAYALNLCTVSVSQIVDYEDSNILDQEYDTILNNLNIQNMPKDDVLLDILKQIMDTVTFFRIAKKERDIANMEYQQKMKDAIWKAIPQANIFLGTNPVMAALSVAATLGTSYMNYRNAKAENKLELVRSRWKLERAAIDQLNGLRRELLNTAWRLAEKYDYPERYRLTEAQISQYDAILMDSNLSRRYDRLYAIRNNFEAYLPFWYYLGNTADMVSRDESLSLETRTRYKQYTIDAFKIYEEKLQIGGRDSGRLLSEAGEEARSKKDNRLLREDHITAMWAIEYLDVLNLDTNLEKDHGKRLVELAVQNAGCSNDILEFCAFAYMKLGERKEASELLKQLVNEGYNPVMNAQLLSELYVQSFISEFKNKNVDRSVITEVRAGYETLGHRVDPSYLYPMPAKSLLSRPDVGTVLESSFIKGQRRVVYKNAQLIVRELVTKYTIRYNKLIPVSWYDSKVIHEDEYFEDTVSARRKRWNDIAALVSGIRKNRHYSDELGESFNAIEIVRVFNDFLNAVVKLDFLTSDDVRELKSSLEMGISAQKPAYAEIEKSFSNGEFDARLIQTLFGMTFKDAAYGFVDKLMDVVKHNVESATTMNALSQTESAFMKMCIDEQLSYPEHYVSKVGKVVEKNNTAELSYGLLSSDENWAKRKKLKDEQIAVCRNYRDSDRLGLKAQKRNEIRFFIYDEPDFKEYLSKYKLVSWVSNPIAILDDTTAVGVGSNKDLVLTTDGIMFVNDLVHKKFVYPYETLRKESNMIVYDTSGFWNVQRYDKGGQINISELYQLFLDLNKLRPDYVPSDEAEKDADVYPMLEEDADERLLETGVENPKRRAVLRDAAKRADVAEYVASVSEKTRYFSIGAGFYRKTISVGGKNEAKGVIVYSETQRLTKENVQKVLSDLRRDSGIKLVVFVYYAGCDDSVWQYVNANVHIISSSNVNGVERDMEKKLLNYIYA